MWEAESGRSEAARAAGGPGAHEAPRESGASVGAATPITSLFEPGRGSSGASPSASELAYGAIGSGAPDGHGAQGASGAPPEEGSAAHGPGDVGAHSLLVDDDGRAKLQPGQMTRGQFLAQLQPHLEAAAAPKGDQKADGQKAAPSPAAALEQWRGKPAAALESAVKKAVPGSQGVKDAQQLVTLVASKAQQAAANPQAAGQPAAPGAATDAAHGGLTSQSVRANLGAGEPIESVTRGRMESAFGQPFSDVRVHNSGAASSMAQQASAHAFAVGSDVVFSAGAYQPGTPMGDALLAHELAHVVQQRGGASTGGNTSAPGALEADADQAAETAVRSIHAPATTGGARANPAMRSGGGVQRCGYGSQVPSFPTVTFTSASNAPSGGGATTFSDAGTHARLTSGPYFLNGSATVAGGTDTDAAKYDVGYYQIFRATDRWATYTGSTQYKKQQTVFSNAPDTVRGSTRPWYNSGGSVTPVTRTGSTVAASMSDQPGQVWEWDSPADSTGTKAKLDKAGGKDQLISYLVARDRSSMDYVVINWNSWEASFAATFNYASAGLKTAAVTGTTNTSTGSGVGSTAPVAPVLNGTLVNDLLNPPHNPKWV